MGKGQHLLFKLLLIYLSLINLWTFDEIISKKMNKINHLTFGNIGNKKSLNIIHWNKSPSHFHNKINNILYIIDRYKPDIFSLSEANFIIDREKSHIKLSVKFNIETTDQY